MVAEKLPGDPPVSTPPAREDEELVQEVIAGKQEAFNELIRRYQHRLYNFAMRFAANHHDAEEIVQETFLKAYHHLRKFRGDARFATWLYQIAKNLCINYYYQSLRHHEAQSISLEQGFTPAGEEGEERGYDLVAQTPSPQEELLTREFLSHFERALRRLEPHFRMALFLRDVEERDYEEIAEILEIPVGTVKSRIHRARLMMQELLEPFLSGEDRHAS